MTTTCFPRHVAAILLASSGVRNKQTPSRSEPGKLSERGLKRKYNRSYFISWHDIMCNETAFLSCLNRFIRRVSAPNFLKVYYKVVFNFKYLLNHETAYGMSLVKWHDIMYNESSLLSCLNRFLLRVSAPNFPKVYYKAVLSIC